MINALIGIYNVLDENRRDVTLTFLVFAAHFLAVVISQVFISRPWNTTVGIFLICGWMVTLVWNGGWALFLMFLGYVSTDLELPRIAIRTIVGYFAVESMICVFGFILPFYACPGISVGILLCAGSYFLYRFMAGLVIDWEKWAKVPALCLIGSVLWLIHEAWWPTIAGWF